MEESVKKELDAIKGLVLRWKKNYLGWAEPEGGNDYLLEEFSEEISTYVSPLIRRMWEGNHLSKFEVHEFLEDCYSQVEDLRHLIKNKETEIRQPKKGVHA